MSKNKLKAKCGCSFSMAAGTHPKDNSCKHIQEPRVVVYYKVYDHLEDWPLDIYLATKKFLKDMHIVYLGPL